MIEDKFKSYNHTIQNGNVTFYYGDGETHTIWNYQAIPEENIDFVLRQVTKWSQSENFQK